MSIAHPYTKEPIKPKSLVEVPPGVKDKETGKRRPATLEDFKKEPKVIKSGMLSGLGTMAKMIGRFIESPTAKSILDLYEGSDLTTALDIYMPFGEPDVKKDMEKEAAKAVDTMAMTGDLQSVKIKDITEGARDRLQTSGIQPAKDKAQAIKDEWAIRTAENAIKTMRSAFTTDEYQTEITSHYPEDVLKKMFKEYILQFGKDGWKQSMFDLRLTHPDPHIFSGAKLGPSGKPQRRVLLPFQTKIGMAEGKAKAEALKERWEMERLQRDRVKSTVAFKRPDGTYIGTFHEARDEQTGLKGRPEDLIRYQALGASHEFEDFTQEELKSIIPPESGAAAADPEYAAKMAQQEAKRKRLQEGLTEADPATEQYRLIQDALKALKELEMAQLTKKKWYQFWKDSPEEEYAKKYKKFEELVVGKEGILYDEKGVIDIATAAEKRMPGKMHPRDPLELDMPADKEELYLPKAKRYAEMHLRARGLWDTYEDTLKDRYRQQGLDYKGTDKNRFADDLSFRRDTLMKQILFTNAILAQIGKGEDISDLKTLMSGRVGGRMQALQDKWARVREESLAGQAISIDKTLIRTFKSDERLAGEEAKKESIFGRIKRAIFGKADGGRVDSMRAMHHGGFVTKTGPAFLQKGEVVFPKSFQDGGQVHGEVSKLLEKDLQSLEVTTKLEVDTGQLEALFDKKELKVDSTPLKVELADDAVVEAKLADDSVVTVDPTPFTDALAGVNLTVEDKEFTAVLADPTVTVEVDSATIARDISSAVATAVSNITVTAEVTGGAIGADEATVAAAIDSMDAKLIAMKGDLEDQISVVGQVDTNEIMASVQTLVNDVVNNTVLEIRGVESVVDNLRSEIQREKDLAVYLKSDVDRRIAELYNTIL